MKRAAEAACAHISGALFSGGKNGGNRNARVPRIAARTDVLRAGVGEGDEGGELSLSEPLCHAPGALC